MEPVITCTQQIYSYSPDGSTVKEALLACWLDEVVHIVQYRIPCTSHLGSCTRVQVNSYIVLEVYHLTFIVCVFHISTTVIRLVTFRMRCSRGKMYIGHTRLCVCP